MLDVESSTQGGPSITLLNPPNSTCPFTGVREHGTNCTRVFFDDRTYLSSAGDARRRPRLGHAVRGVLRRPAGAAVRGPGDRHRQHQQRAGVRRRRGPQRQPVLPDDGRHARRRQGPRRVDVLPVEADRRRRSTCCPVPAAPVAQPDTETTPVNTPLVVPAPGRAGQRRWARGSAWSPAPRRRPSHGSVTTNADGSYTYTPVAGLRRARTSSSTRPPTTTARQATTTVTITVTPVAARRRLDHHGEHAADGPGARRAGQRRRGSGCAAGSASTPAHGTVALDPSGALRLHARPRLLGHGHVHLRRLGRARCPPAPP